MQAQKPFSPALRASPRSGSLATLASLSAALLGGCLSDGPNGTGRAFLADQGVVLNGSAYDIVLDSVPLKDWQAIGEEPSHLSDTVLMLGNWRGVRSELRFGYSLETAALLDTLDAAREDSAIQVSLSLGFFAWRKSDNSKTAAQNYLESTLKGRDSLKLVVTALDLPDTVSKTSFAEGRDIANRAFLVRSLPLPVAVAQMENAERKPVSIADTVSLAVDKLYGEGRDSLPKLTLPHLRKHLAARRYDRRYLLVQVKTLATEAANDSQGVMLRVVGGAGDYYRPSLLFGKAVDPRTASTKTNRLYPYEFSTGVWAVNSVAEDLLRDDSAFSLAPRKGLRFRIERQDVLDRLKAYFAEHNMGAMPVLGTGEFDARYFVAYAEMQLPVDTATSWIENRYAFDVKAVTELDSAFENSHWGKPASWLSLPLEVKIPSRSDWPSLWVLTRSTSKGEKVDSVRAFYAKSPDSSRHYLFFSLASDTTRDIDTLLVTPGIPQEKVLNLARLPLMLRIAPTDSNCGIEYILRPNEVTESNVYRNPSDPTEALTDNRSQARRFLTAHRESLTLRATLGLQNVLNRVYTQTRFSEDPPFAVDPNFSIQLANRTPFESDTSDVKIPYPVLGRVRFQNPGAGLHAQVRLILFPLSQP